MFCPIPGFPIRDDTDYKISGRDDRDRISWTPYTLSFPKMYSFICMKSLGVIKPWKSLIWHNFVKIDVVEKLANFDVNFEGEGVEISEN